MGLWVGTVLPPLLLYPLGPFVLAVHFLAFRKGSFFILFQNRNIQNASKYRNSTTPKPAAVTVGVVLLLYKAFIEEQLLIIICKHHIIKPAKCCSLKSSIAILLPNFYYVLDLCDYYWKR